MEINFKYCKPFFACLWAVGIFIIGFCSILGILYRLMYLIKEIFGDWTGATVLFIILLSFGLSGISAFLLAARITEKTGKAIIRETESEIILNEHKVILPYCVIKGISYVKTTSGDLSSLLAGKLRIDLTNGKKLTVHSSQWEEWKKKREYGLWWIIRQGQYLPDVSLKQVYDELRKRARLCGFYSEIEEIANG